MDKNLGINIVKEARRDDGQKLSPQSSKHLVQILVKYLCNKNVWVEKADFNQLWLKIQAAFPKENKVTLKMYLNIKNQYTNFFVFSGRLY